MASSVDDKTSQRTQGLLARQDAGCGNLEADQTDARSATSEGTPTRIAARASTVVFRSQRSQRERSMYNRQVLVDYFNGKRRLKDPELKREFLLLKEQAAIDWKATQSMILARTSEGRQRAMARGIKFGRKPKLSAFQIAEALRRREAGEPLTEIAKTYSVSHSTISRL